MNQVVPAKPPLVDVTNPHPDVGWVPSVPLHVQTEAEKAVKRYEELCAPAGDAAVRAWLLPLVAAVKNPPPKEFIVERAAAIAFVVAQLPRAVFTSSTQRAAVTKFEFWPSAAEVNALLQAEAYPLLRRLDALRKIVAAQPTASAPEPTPDEKAAIVAKFRADMAAAGLPLRAPR